MDKGEFMQVGALSAARWALSDRYHSGVTFGAVTDRSMETSALVLSSHQKIK